MSRPDTTKLFAEVSNLGIRLVPHSQWRLFWVVRLYYLFKKRADAANGIWITLPKRIVYPDNVSDPYQAPTKLAHELVHVRQIKRERWWWIWYIKYLSSWRFRWRMEREAYLVEIRAGVPVDDIVAWLPTYGIKKDPLGMKAWFAKNS